MSNIIGAIVRIVVLEFFVMVVWFTSSMPVDEIINTLMEYGLPDTLGASIVMAYSAAFLIAALVPLLYGVWYATREEYDEYKTY